MVPKFFATPAKFRAWLDKHGETEKELIVGFYKKQTGRPSITWPESVDEALCVGWIDGVKKRIDEESYQQRFSPRRKGSIWSRVNIRRMGELIAEGRVSPAGMAAFERRLEERSEIYAYEQSEVTIGAEEMMRFQAEEAAWAWFERQSPTYRQRMLWWVASAKGTDTRERRLDRLIEMAREQRRM